MAHESKPPMRQIAELIDGIATARAESAERALANAEVDLLEARLGEKAALETIADRDAEIARLKAELDTALEDAEKWRLQYAGAMADYRHEVESRLEAPTEDPRIAALCRFATIILHGHNLGPTLWDAVGDLSTGIILNGHRDLETIAGHR